MTSAAVEIGTFEHHSPAWYAAREGGLGGSEIAAVMGLSPWQSKFSLWHYKAGMVPGQVETPAMSWGARLEGPIADKFAEDHPEFTMTKTGTWRSIERPWQIANPDRLLSDRIYEGKTAHLMDAHEWGETGTDQIPVYYRCQALWYLDVFGYDICHIALLIGGSDYREYVIDYDQLEALVLREAGQEFMTSLREDRRPDIDGSDATYQAIRKLHPDIDGSEKDIPGDLADRYLTACADLKAAQVEKQQVGALILDLMGDAQYAVAGGVRIAQRVSSSDRVPHLRPAQNRKAA